MDDLRSEKQNRPLVTDGGEEPRTQPRSDRSQRSTVWETDRPEDPNSLDTLWIRWTDGGSDIHFHRVCEIVPQVKFSRSWPFILPKPEGEKLPIFEPVYEGDDQVEDQEVQFKFVSGVPRQLLRHVPLVILVAAIMMFAGPEVFSTLDVGGWSAFIPQFTSNNATLFGLFVVITPFLIWLLAEVEVVESQEIASAGVVYGLISVLGLGVLISLLNTVTVDHPTQVEPNVVLTSGYLLTLLLGGMLLYEGVLRIEHLFVQLGERDQDIINNRQEYLRFLTDLNEALNEKRILGIVHPSRVFGVLFATQFFIVWTIGSGPQNMDYTIGLIVNFVLNTVLVTIAFKFFILIRFFNKLINEKKEYGKIGLHYEPFHIDGYGGFRDFGRFATRINIILTLAGLYLVYRLYIIGGLDFPMEGLTGFTDPLVLTIWLISFVAPVGAYAFGAAVWGYYSFWSMHVKMERDKQMLARKYQGQRGDWNLNRTPSAGDTIESFEYCNGPEWDSFRSAPTWPIDINKMLSLISTNAIPLLIPVVNLFL